VKASAVANTPTIKKRTVARGRLPNASYRTREYLSEREVERLMKAAGNNRHGHRVQLGLPAWAPGIGVVFASLGAGRSGSWPPSRFPPQERHGFGASADWHRTSGAASIAA
jgi:hypothetical protein